MQVFKVAQDNLTPMGVAVSPSGFRSQRSNSGNFAIFGVLGRRVLAWRLLSNILPLI